MKKYKLRMFSPLWWAIRVLAGTGIAAGCYSWIILLTVLSNVIINK